MLFILAGFQNCRLFADVVEVESISEFQMKLSEMYSEVNLSDITTGILYGSKLSYAEFLNYRGSSDDSIMSNTIFRQIYSELYEFDEGSSQMMSFEDVDQNYTSYFDLNKALPISIFNYKYNMLDTIAYINGEFYYDSLTYNKFLPADGFSSIPLIESKLFCGSVLKNFIIGQNIKFVIASDFIFTNTDLIINYFEVDFDDGNGYRDVNVNSNVNVNYSNSGIKIIKLIAHFSNSSIVLNSSFEIKIFAENVPSPDSTINIEVPAVIPGEGSYSRGTAWVHYGSGHTALVKPVIVVEGFDVSNQYNHDEIYSLLNTENMATELLSDGYDLIMLNFHNGGNYIQNNAEVLRHLINEINNIKAPGNKNVIIGASMGGLISRFTLASMEKTGEDHDTRLFISYDSPQFGANIPLSMQYLAKNLESFYKDGMKQLDSPAAKQMLIYHYSNSTPNGNHHSFRDDLFSSLADVGNYPASLRKVSISNGSGNPLAFNGGELMLDCEANISETGIILGIDKLTRIIIEFQLRSINTSETTVFKGSLKFFVRVPTGLPFPPTRWQPIYKIPWENKTTCALLLDNAPGGTRPTYYDLGQTFKKYTTLPPFGLKIGSASIYHDNHCFIPTFSSLGIESTDAHYNVHSDPDARDKSYFDEIYRPSNPSDNQDHILVTSENKIWFISEIKGIPVTLKNVYDGENIEHTTLAVDAVNNSINSGETVVLQTLTEYIIRTNHKMIDGHNKMHHHWNESVSSFKMHKSLYVEPGISNQEAWFQDYDSCVIANNLGSLAGINIHDPWYQDASGNQPDDFRPLSEVAPDGIHEIFRNQEYEQSPDENKPHYSIKADENFNTEEHNTEEVKWYFQNWYSPDGGADINNASALQTDVVFRPEGEELIANYKGHLASNTSRATGYNNGRRIAVESNYTLHAVYEDGGDIWYTYSTDDGETWEPEKRVSNFSDSYGNPFIANMNPTIDVSIGQTGEGTVIHIVWEQISDWNGQYPSGVHEIGYVKKNNYGWSDPIPVSTDPDHDIGFTEARPSVYTESGGDVYIAWRAKPNGYSTEQVFIYTFVDDYDALPEEVPGAHGFPIIDKGENCVLTKIVYEEEGDLWYVSGEYNYRSWSWNDPVNLTGSYPLMFDKKNPSMTLRGSRFGHITWDAIFDFGGERCLYYQVYDFYNNAEPWWSYPAELAYNGTDAAFNPSISLNHSTDVASIYYEQSGKIYRKKHDNGSWSKTSYSSGKYPAAAKDGGSGAIWTKYTEAPYLIKSDYVSPSNPVSPIVPGWKFKYQLTAAENNGQEGFIQFEIIGISFDNQILNFNRELTSDSLVANASVIPVDVQLAVSYHQVNVPLNSEELLLKVDFVEGSNIIPLTDVRYYELPANNTVFQKSVNKNNLHTRYGNVT
jgi:hypothetical protein